MVWTDTPESAEVATDEQPQTRLTVAETAGPVEQKPVRGDEQITDEPNGGSLHSDVVADRFFREMLHACGGTGYKPALGIERLLRDGKAGWVMGPTNEVLRQFVGKSALLGFEVLDYWNQSVNQRVLSNELKKMSKEEKAAFATKLLAEAQA